MHHKIILLCQNATVFQEMRSLLVLEGWGTTKTLLLMNAAFVSSGRANRYYHRYFNTLHEGCSPQPDMTTHKFSWFFNYCKDCTQSKGHIKWLLFPVRTVYLFVFNRNKMKHCHFLRFLHFSNKKCTTSWDITPRSPLKVNQRYGGTYHLHLQGQP
jgi:hypothetical protein